VSARFRFRLEPVLDHRARREELAQQELSRALAALSAQEEVAVAAERRVGDELAALRALLAGPVPLLELRAAHDAVAHARRVAEHERAGADRLDAVALDRRADLMRASQEREALTKLRGRQQAAHEREVERREGALVDELAARRHADRARRSERRAAAG
jgi:flagellar protein FliJ